MQDLDKLNQNVLYHSGVVKKANAAVEEKYASENYEQITSTSDGITVLDLEQSLQVFDGETSIENADGSLFDISGFKSVKICATLDSNGLEVCKSGSASVFLELLPSISDTTVPFTAVITSNNGEDREYNVSAVVNVLVQESGKFPSLVCGGGSEGDICVIPDLKNKVSKESVQLKVLKPTDAGAVSGQIYIVDIEVTRDDFARNFKFVLTDASGNVVNLGDKTALFNPNDTLTLEVSFDKGEASQIEGVIKYAVVTGDQIVIRQLNFGFDAGDVIDWWKLILLLLAAYLLTIAVPYAFLLWSARRSAVLNIPGDEFSFLVLPFEITQEGKLKGTGEIPVGATFAPNHKNLEQRSVAPNTRTVTIDAAQISIEPPKWYPFENVKTRISIPGNYVLPSFNSLTNAINSNCDAVVSQSPAIGTTVGVGTHLITMTANGSVSCNFNLVVEAALSNEDFNPNSNIVIYPNPTNSILNIKGEFNSLEKIAVYNMLGQVVMENVVSGNENQLNVSSLANGIYQIRFMDSKKTVKFVKE